MYGERQGYDTDDEDDWGFLPGTENTHTSIINNKEEPLTHMHGSNHTQSDHNPIQTLADSSRKTTSMHKNLASEMNTDSSRKSSQILVNPSQKIVSMYTDYRKRKSNSTSSFVTKKQKKIFDPKLPSVSKPIV